MAIFDPSKQIQQIGADITANTERLGQQIVGREQNKTAQTQRVMAQLAAIRDEAAVMHQDILQEEIQKAHAEISDQIFKQRKDGTTKIDIKGLTGLNKTITRLKNMASNSQSAAQKYGEVLNLVNSDPYVFNKGGAYEALTNIIADPASLTLPPNELENQLAGVYTDSVDNVARTGDYIAKNYGKRVGSRDIMDGDNRINIAFDIYDGIQNELGQVTKEGMDKLQSEFTRQNGRPASQEELLRLAVRLGSSRKVTNDFGAVQQRLDQADQRLSNERNSSGIMDEKQAKDAYFRMVNGVTSRNLSEIQAAIGSQKKVKWITKQEVYENFDGNPPEGWQETLGGVGDNMPVGLMVEDEAFPLTEDGLKQAYFMSNNKNLGQDARAFMQSYQLSEDGINLYDNMVKHLGFPRRSELTPDLPNWEVYNESLINSYSAHPKDNQQQDPPKQEKSSESTKKMTWPEWSKANPGKTITEYRAYFNS